MPNINRFTFRTQMCICHPPLYYQVPVDSDVCGCRLLCFLPHPGQLVVRIKMRMRMRTVVAVAFVAS